MELQLARTIRKTGSELGRELTMELKLIDGEWLSVTVPQGFQAIPQGELESLMGFKYDYMWGMRNADRHMVAAVTWKDSNGVLTKLASEKSLAKRVDETNAKRYRKHGYRRNGFFAREVAGASAQAQGVRFSYDVEGVAHEGEALVFKRGTRCYTLYYYTRSDAAAENRPIYEEIASSLAIR